MLAMTMYANMPMMIEIILFLMVVFTVSPSLYSSDANIVY